MLKMFKKETEIDKLNEEIKSMEFKKNSILSAINNEKIDILNKKRLILEEIGSIVFENHISGSNNTDFTSQFEKIDAFQANVEEKNMKSTEIEKRYDEEINMLRANMEKLQVSAQGGSSFCSNCGVALTPDDVFCQKCGTKV